MNLAIALNGFSDEELDIVFQRMDNYFLDPSLLTVILVDTTHVLAGGAAFGGFSGGKAGAKPGLDVERLRKRFWDPISRNVGCRILDARRKVLLPQRLQLQVDPDDVNPRTNPNCFVYFVDSSLRRGLSRAILRARNNAGIAKGQGSNALISEAELAAVLEWEMGVNKVLCAKLGWK